MDQDFKKELLDILYAKSFRYDPAKGFTLASGKKSDVYIDAKKTVLSSHAMELVGFAFFQLLKLAPVDAIGGLTLGADPIAYAAALVSTMHGKYMDAFIVRKEPKGHGTQQWIEGSLQDGVDVVVVEDVVTTGGSAITAVKRVREAGYNVRQVLALVDREEGGKENIEKETGCKFYALFTKSDFLELHEKNEKKKEAEAKKAETKKGKPDERPFF
ncbi:MAG: orotate phosphoribosyltransferase [Deltaproteobacteria bacterium]|nr:orotate phosphoribosyltransferase [Deltaproteobacteria bacterium]MBI5901996.1 orotate phosphoribosyltransferase [Deltaproteobacteria bacterium]